MIFSQHLFPKCISCSGEPRGISEGVQTGINSLFVPLLYRQGCLALDWPIHFGKGILDMGWRPKNFCCVFLITILCNGCVLLLG
jgi:hypothetical protein